MPLFCPNRRRWKNLAVDLSCYNIDVAVITETYFKLTHSDTAIAIDGYTIFRRAGLKVRGFGGSALTSEMSPTISDVSPSTP
jgi:hypothetical protein